MSSRSSLWSCPRCGLTIPVRIFPVHCQCGHTTEEGAVVIAPTRVSKDSVRSELLKICETCPEYAGDRRCKLIELGCRRSYVEAAQSGTCPLDKWRRTEMEWSYGVTAVPDRIHNGLLERTLASLKRSGFDAPHIFVDGMSPGDWEQCTGAMGQLDVTVHKHRVRAFGNWMMAAWELYVLKPHAERYAIFQDDMETCLGLREYLSRCPYPEKGYLNLYTFRMNEKPIRGFYPSNQLGKGAVALVFDNETMRTLLASRYMVDRPLNFDRGHKAIDGGVVSALKLLGWKEYVHNPSLVQHTGMVSAIGNSRHELAPTFPGVDYDVTGLLEEMGVLPDPAAFRIGIVGYLNDPVNQEIVRNTDVSLWLAKPSGNVLTDPVLQEVDTIFCPHGHEKKIRRFLRDVDVVVFTDTSPPYEGLLPLAKEQWKRIVVVTGYETDRLQEGMLDAADLVICTTVERYNELRGSCPCAEFTWPSKWHTGADREFNLLVRTGEHRVAILD